MGALDQTYSNSILDASLDSTGAAVRLSTGPFKIRLMTTNGTATANGTEITSGGSYTSGGNGIGTLTAAQWAAASAGSKATNTAVSLTNMPSCTVNGLEIWDSSTTPKRLYWGAITGAPKTVNAGDTFTIASGSLSVALT